MVDEEEVDVPREVEQRLEQRTAVEPRVVHGDKKAAHGRPNVVDGVDGPDSCGQADQGPEMQLSLTALDGSKVSVKVRASTTIAQLKFKLEQECGKPAFTIDVTTFLKFSGDKDLDVF